MNNYFTCNGQKAALEVLSVFDNFTHTRQKFWGKQPDKYQSAEPVCYSVPAGYDSYHHTWESAQFNTELGIF